MTKKARVEWIDIVKLLGMIAVFCGHFGEAGGRLYGFVFCYHVPLFFFAAGIFAGNLDKQSFKDAVKKRFVQIMFPYMFFVTINMAVMILASGDDLITYVRYVKQFIWGVRNHMPTAALWFFPCIFCTGVLFDVLRRVCRKDILVAVAAAVLYLTSVTLFPNRPDVEPSWFWNIDSACYYMIYYAFGYILRNKLIPAEQERNGSERTQRLEINGAKEKADKIRRYLFLIGAVLLTGYAVSIYLQEDIAGRMFCRVVPAAGIIYPVVRTMLLIGFNLILAKLLEGFHFLSYAGTQTLWLCGNENIVKTLIGTAAGLVSLKIEVTDELSVLIYAVVMTVVIIKILLPIEQKLYGKCLVKSVKGHENADMQI